MTEIRTLPVAVTYRGCPGCGYIFNQREVNQLRFDQPCPMCATKHISDFIPLTAAMTVALTKSRRDP